MREMSGSEPLVTHRNGFRRHQTWSCTTAPGRVWRKPTYWPRGVRCIGGMTLIRALVDCSVIARKRGNARGAKGAGHRRWERANWQQEEPHFSTEGGGLRSVARAG